MGQPTSARSFFRIDLKIAWPWCNLSVQGPFLDALASLKTMLVIKSLMFSRFQDYSVLESFAECYSVTEYYRVLQSVTECYRVLQSIREY